MIKLANIKKIKYGSVKSKRDVRNGGSEKGRRKGEGG